MKKLIWLTFMVCMITACNSHSKNMDPQLTAIISSDSVTIFNGQLNNDTRVQKIVMDEKAVKTVLADFKNKINQPLSLALQLDPNGGQAGIIGNLVNVAHWSEDTGIREFIFSSNDTKKIQRFNSAADLQHFLDSVMMHPISLNLVMPKDEPETSTEEPENHSLTCLLISNNKIYCYKGTDINAGSFYSLSGTNTFRKLLQDEMKKRPNDSLMVLIKFTDEANYKNMVDLLDEITINKVKKYAVVKLSDKENSFLKTKNN